MDLVKIEWSKDVVLTLIRFWKEKELLYNSKNPLYHNKHARVDALEDISKKMNEIVPNMTPSEIKIKISYLRSQYGREILKIAECSKSGSGADDLYVPTAYWFEHLHFLRDLVSVRKGISNLTKEILTDSMSTKEDSSLLSYENLNESLSDSREQSTKSKRKRVDDSDVHCDSLLKDASNIISVLKESCNQPKYDESLVNFFKVNMQEITDKDLKDEVTSKVMMLLFEYKKKQRQLIENI